MLAMLARTRTHAPHAHALHCTAARTPPPPPLLLLARCWARVGTLSAGHHYLHIIIRTWTHHTLLEGWESACLVAL